MDNCLSTAGRHIVSSTPTVSSASSCAANHGVHPEYTGSLKTALWEYHVKHVCPCWDVEYILMCTSMSHAQDLQYTHTDNRKTSIRASCSSCLVMFLFPGTNALHFNLRTLLQILCTTFSCILQFNDLKCPCEPRIPSLSTWLCLSKWEPPLFCFYFSSFVGRCNN